MKNAIFLLSVLMIGILLFGCASQQVIPNGEDNVTVQPNVTAQSNKTVQPGGLEFSVPSELPIAYVGTPLVYSFNPTGGRTPYEITYKLRETAYNGSEHSALLSDWSGFPQPYGASKEQLNFTPQPGDEGQYLLEFCVKEGGDYRNKPVCKNTTLYILSDNVTVKGSGKVTSSLMWDPHVTVKVWGRGGDFTDGIKRPDRLTFVSLSEIPDVKINVSTPPKDSNPGSPYSLGSSGGARVEFEMVANPTGVSQSAVGDAACGTLNQDGSVNALNVDSFQVLGTTDIGLNITNDGTTEKVVDIFITGRSTVSSDSKYYGAGGTEVMASIGDTKFDLNPYGYTMTEFNQFALKPGEEVTDSKVDRVIVAPGSHVVYIGYVDPNFDGGGLGMGGCPTHLGLSSGMTIRVVDADLSDGKLPTLKICNTCTSIRKINIYDYSG